MPIDFEMPFTANLAEQDLQTTKLRMVIAESFRSEQGEREFTAVRGVLSTAFTQGRNAIGALLSPSDNPVASLSC